MNFQKYCLTVGLLFFSIVNAFCQFSDDPASTRYWDAQANLFGKRVISTDENGFAVCGEADIWSGGNQYSGAFLVVSDSSGAHHWEKCYTTFYNDFSFEMIAQWSDSTFLAAGKMMNPMTNTHGGALIKLDKNGNELWKASVENGVDQNCVIKNSLIVSGSTALLLGTREVMGGASFVMLIDSSGTKLWSVDIQDPNAGVIKLEGVVRMDNGDYLISGAVSEDIYWKGLLVRLNAQGQVLWSKKFDQLNSSFTDIIFDGTDVYLRNQNSADVINGVIKCDTSGNVLWHQNAYAQDIYMWGKEGRRTLSFDVDSTIIFYYQDPYSSTYIKLAGDGTVVSAISEMGRSDGFTSYADSSVAFLLNGPTFGIKKSSALSLEHFVVTRIPFWQGQGSTCIWDNSILLNPVTGNSFADYPLLVGDSYQLVPALMELVTWFPTIDHNCVDFLGGIQEQDAQIITLYPNPAEDELHVSINNPVGEAVIRNAWGEEVRTFNVSTEKVLEIKALAPGFYFLQVGDQMRSFVKK